MAELIRQDFLLPTLRFSMQFVNGIPTVLIRAYHGREELTAEEIAAAEIGISERLSVRAYRNVEFNLPGEVISRLDRVLAVRQEGAAVAANRPFGRISGCGALGAAAGRGHGRTYSAHPQFPH